MLQSERKIYIKFKKDEKNYRYIFLLTVILILQVSSSTKTDVFANNRYTTLSKTEEIYKIKNAHVRKESSHFSWFPVLPSLSL